MKGREGGREGGRDEMTEEKLGVRENMFFPLRDTQTSYYYYDYVPGRHGALRELGIKLSAILLL